MNVGIVGGGIAGLTAAYELSKAGHKVTVFEKQPFLGGQAATFEVEGARLEAFYHHIFTNDVDIISLIEELGLGDRLLWLDSQAGFWHGEKIWNFVTPIDLLKFSPIGLVDRVRLGLVSLYLRWQKDWRRYEGITAKEWIIKYAGQRNYDVLWGPLLRGKFGQSADEVSMVWFWGKIHLRFASRSKGSGREKLGYLRGSFGLIIDALDERIRASGGEILVNAPVSRVIVEDGSVKGVDVKDGEFAGIYSFDKVLAAVPSPLFLDIVPDIDGEYAEKLRKARYQAAVCLVVVLKKSVSYIYWLNISDPAIPFVAAIEHTNLLGSDDYGGKYILYLSNYVSRDNPLYRASADELVEAYIPHLKRINPQFTPDWIKSVHRFADDAGQPIVATYYSQQIPDHQTPVKGLYLANTTQIYPEDRGMNYSVRMGRDVARIIDR